jgi:hypothetical protein
MPILGRTHFVCMRPEEEAEAAEGQACRRSLSTACAILGVAMERLDKSFAAAKLPEVGKNYQRSSFGGSPKIRRVGHLPIR